jgi:hypothetical protein
MADFAASFPQIMLSAGTLAVACLVYRVQADKLFLEMRGERLASLDRFKTAASARFTYILGIKFENLENILGSEHETMMRAYWDAQRDLSLWFGPDVYEASKAVDAALGEWEQRVIRFESEMPPRRNLAAHSHALDGMTAADKMMGALVQSAHPYIAAGRRGLPFGDHLRIRKGWRPKARWWYWLKRW